MDNIKDIKNDIGQNKPAHNEAKNLNPIDFFSKNESFVFVYKKTEKLATALYMVTNLFDDAEPMKWTLRSRVAHLLSFIIGFKDILSSREEEFSHGVKTKVLEIVSLLEIACRSGLISMMNFSILKDEFMNLLQFLSDFRKESGHYGDLEKGFFKTSHTKYISQNDLKGETSLESSDTQRHERVVLDIPKRTNRQNIIINLLKKKKEITIHDVAVVISDCSEKTIQRELISLIKLGLVTKTGQRRWSKYFLTNQE